MQKTVEGKRASLIQGIFRRVRTGENMYQRREGEAPAPPISFCGKKGWDLQRAEGKTATFGPPSLTTLSPKNRDSVLFLYSHNHLPLCSPLLRLYSKPSERGGIGGGGEDKHGEMRYSVSSALCVRGREPSKEAIMLIARPAFLRCFSFLPFPARRRDTDYYCGKRKKILVVEEEGEEKKSCKRGKRRADGEKAAAAAVARSVPPLRRRQQRPPLHKSPAQEGREKAIPLLSFSEPLSLSTGVRGAAARSGGGGWRMEEEASIPLSILGLHGTVPPLLLSSGAFNVGDLNSSSGRTR